MSSAYKVYLKRIDLVDRKLPLFCLVAKSKLDTKFTVERNGTVFQLSLGLTEDLPEIYAYTEIQFEADLDPVAEQAELEERVRSLLPLAREAVNAFRAACRVALFRESVAGRILVENIQAKQRHWGVEVNHSLAEYFSGSDTEFLFGAFANLSFSSFTGDADIAYCVTTPAGESYEGVFKNGYRGLRSPDRFRQKLDAVQDLLDNGWAVETDILLASLEFLYADNYRMAVFNAATILELAVVQFWEEKKRLLNAGARQDKEKAAKLDRDMDESRYPTKVEKIIRIVLPEFVEQDLVAGGALDRCVAAWEIRNKRLAHLYEKVKEGKQTQVTASEAWNAVASIITLLEKLQLPIGAG
jgi:hypothetical protein